MLYFVFHSEVSFSFDSKLDLSVDSTIPKFFRFDITLGKTSSTVRSTNTPPTNRNALRLGSSGVSASSTKLEQHKNIFQNHEVKR
mmetsp:Transcript_9388/g.13325  ORF Transcript_9388/g.13325 Transcript_9388/m.13325 type:complete len:85 (+) Transcript_9388:379-633(+)